ncbi:MAG TPA: hypothetical protein VMD56_11420 [Steroidobacteraceae bacterium]|nr:hypothetical protein [Steroidobacteraceae bacterium]
MKTSLMSALLMSAALAGLPAVGSAAEPPAMQSCVRAFMQQLTAGAAKPMKVVEGRESDSSLPYMPGAPEYVLTARAAQSDRTIARVVCTTDGSGKVRLLEDRSL